jgi:hypothetical protein
LTTTNVAPYGFEPYPPDPVIRSVASADASVSILNTNGDVDLSVTPGAAGTVTAVTGTIPIVITGGASPTPNVTITDFIASGASHARGSVPDPGATAGITKFLREDATFQVPPGAAQIGVQFNWGKYIAGRGSWVIG